MALFEPGQSGNPKGRPKGTKVSTELRELIGGFLIDKFETIILKFDELSPREQARVYCDLLQYAAPKMQSMSMAPDFENMTDEQLDQIINGLMEKAR